MTSENVLRDHRRVEALLQTRLQSVHDAAVAKGWARPARVELVSAVEGSASFSSAGLGGVPSGPAVVPS